MLLADLNLIAVLLGMIGSCAVVKVALVVLHR